MSAHDKLTRLLSLFDHRSQYLSTVPDPIAQSLAQSYTQSLEQVRSLLHRDSESAPRAGLAIGFLQAFSELPTLIQQVAPAHRDECMHQLERLIASEVPDLANTLNALASRALQRGKIKSEVELWMVRREIDRLEVSEPGSPVLATLLDMATEFSTRTLRTRHSDA